MSEAMKILEANIRTAIKAARKSGTCGMSLACLKANTSTAGLTCSVAEYHAAFAAAAAKVAKVVRGFEIYGEN